MKQESLCRYSRTVLNGQWSWKGTAEMPVLKEVCLGSGTTSAVVPHLVVAGCVFALLSPLASSGMVPTIDWPTSSYFVWSWKSNPTTCEAAPSPGLQRWAVTTHQSWASCRSGSKDSLPHLPHPYQGRKHLKGQNLDGPGPGQAA